MKNLPVLILFCALFFSVTASFARKGRALPIHYAGPAAAQKGTSNTNPVLAQTTYDYSLSPAAQLLDSLRLFYSNGHGSSFDFDNLYYDFDNQADDPDNRLLVSSFVNFDSLRTYDPPHSSHYTTTGIRSYDAAGRVTRFVQDSTQIVYYNYDVTTGRLASTLTLSFTGSSYDTAIRHTYTYGIYGSVMRDSTFSRVGTTWKATQVMVATNNSLAYPVQRTENQVSGATLIPLRRSNYVYNAANRPTSIIRQTNIGGSTLRNQSKDSFEFAANSMLITHYAYAWDTASAAWLITSVESRHLDAVFSQPDSVWMRAGNGHGGFDTLIQKLAYNDAGDPVYLRSYDATGRTLMDETRWYYRLTINGHGVGVNPLAANSEAVFIYPNPASSQLYVTGCAGKRYSIRNAAGQLVQSGVLNASAGAQVESLSAGVYSILVQGSKGIAGAATFIRR